MNETVKQRCENDVFISFQFPTGVSFGLTQPVIRFQRAAQGDEVSMQEWPSHSGRVCPQRTAVQTTPPRPDTLQPGVLQFENFRELLGCSPLNPGAMGHDGGHPDPPARILVDICSPGYHYPQSTPSNGPPTTVV
jgi:hypothetical protein